MQLHTFLKLTFPYLVEMAGQRVSRWEVGVGVGEGGSGVKGYRHSMHVMKNTSADHQFQRQSLKALEATRCFLWHLGI